MYRDLYDESLQYNREAIAYALQEEPHSKQLSLAYSKLGRTFIEMNVPDSAKYYFELALSQAKMLNDTIEIGVGYGQLGVVYQKQKDYAKSLEYAKLELDLHLQRGDTAFFFYLNEETAYNVLRVAVKKQQIMFLLLGEHSYLLSDYCRFKYS